MTKDAASRMSVSIICRTAKCNYPLELKFTVLTGLIARFIWFAEIGNLL